MRKHWTRVDGCLAGEGVSLQTIAEEYGTPCFVYSQAALLDGLENIRAAFSQSSPAVCYAVKANGNVSLLKILARHGAGFDIVSGGELARVLAAGSDAESVVFSGAGKSAGEIAAALAAGIGGFNVESAPELARIKNIAAAQNKKAKVSIRVTPDINAATHRHLTTGMKEGKFGVLKKDLAALAKQACAESSLDFLGLSCHLGSQITSAAVYCRAARQMAALADDLRKTGIAVRRVDMGGGFAADYDDGGLGVDLSLYDSELAKLFCGTELIIEPGRAIVAAAGVLLTSVEYVKPSAGGVYWIVDAGMSELIRPMLYDAAHRVETVTGGGPKQSGDVAGPICESADILAKNQKLAAQAGDLLAIFDVGAYGSVMGSNYNARPKPCEILINGKQHKCIRRRETTDDMLSPERFATAE